MEEKIYSALRRIVDRLLFMEKRTILEFGGVKLFPSEIHLLLAVQRGEEQARNATRIAERLGVTKGAVSQTLSRLARKKIITKSTDPANKNELILSFTPLGERVMEQLALWHDQMPKGKPLSDFSSQEHGVILRFLEGLEKTLFEGLDEGRD